MVHAVLHYEEIQYPRRENRQKCGHEDGDNGGESPFLNRGVYHFSKMWGNKYLLGHCEWNEAIQVK